MTYLITGIGGFVGSHLARILALEDGVRTVGMVRDSSQHEASGGESGAGAVDSLVTSAMDSVDGLREILDSVQPDRIVHLAAQSSVGESWRSPATTFFNNSNIFLNLLEAIRQSGDVGSCRLLSVGSSEQYGNSLPRDSGYVETDPQVPNSPYAVARTAQEQLARVYVDGFGMDIVCTRSFNHIGPGQSDRFVVSALARRCVEVAAGQRSEVSCGNLEVVRDFVDVRDVCRAYSHLMNHGDSGEVYNVCSGHGTELRSLLTRFTNILDIDPKLKVDRDLIRPLDNPVVIGNSEKLQQLGWQTRYSLEETLSDVVEDWRRKI
jgi:GDP-4-dehydro-6-deoxy-D-mannose reductase